MKPALEPTSLPASLIALVGIIIIIGTVSSWALWTVAGNHRFKTNGLPAGPHGRLKGNLSFAGILLLGAALVAGPILA